ncbi:nrps [Neopestalotiopsis sp. 37M]|nr:nrps [Neopestalotiopsis sp. 37M]
MRHSKVNELRHPEEKVASHQDQLEYWTEQLADSCAAEFFTDFIRPPSLSGQVESIPVVIDGCVYETLQAFCSSRDVSVFAVLLAVFRATHYRLTGAEDATIGTSPFSRSRLETQCMRVIVADDDTLASLVRQVKSTVGTASKYQEIPFGTVTEALLEAKEISRHPLVRLIFAMHAKQEVNSQFEGSDEVQSSRFDMQWSLVEENGKLGGSVLYARELFARASVRSILKANLSYLPLDINVPTARIETILSNVTEPRVVLFGSNMSVPNIQLPNIESTRISDTLGQQDLDDLRAVRPSATSLAYVIFTSGSTGTPKGVMVEHRSLLRLVKHSNLTSKLPAEPTRVAHLTNIAFDVSLLEMCTALLHGSTLICIDYATVLDSKAIEAVFAQERIRVAMLPPALLQQCLVNMPASLGALDVLFVAGDRFNSHDAAVAQKLVGPGVYNAYGPTENGILSTMYNIGGSEAFVSGVPIGRAVSNSGAYIMDRNQQLVPAGVIGELVVTGDGLARGYTDRNQDVDRFIYVNIEGRNVRAYRTGDRARCRPTDGQIEFFGRIDQQFKIRGHRIEPAEIEQCMLNHLTVQEAAVVVAAAQKDQDPRIVAFAVADVQGSAKEGHVDNGLTGALTFQQSQYVMDLEKDIRNWLQTFFPSYMIPARIVVLKQMPLNTNGKIDRKKLVQIAVASLKIRLVAARVLPRNETEAVLCEEFAKLFGNIEIGITDSFFDLGGHSLMATKLAARLSSRLDARVSVKHVLDLPVLADLAATIRCGSKSHSPIPRIDYVGPVEQSFAQGRMWFFHQLDPRSEQYLVPLAVRLHGPLHTVALSKALHALEQRHETLRTTFETMDGVGMQVVHPFRKSELRVTSVPDSQKASLIRLLHEEQTTPFKLESEPGWRVSLFRFGEDDHVLSIVMHHIISDDWSIDILQQELARFYSAALHGQAILPPGSHLLAQYREFSAWEKQEEQMASQERQLQYWVKQLKDSTPAELLNDHQRPAALSGQAGEVQFMIDSDLYEKAETFCRDRQVTWFVVLLSAFRATHFRLTGVEDSNIGTPVANRSRQELEDIIGFFVNTQCLRITIDKDDTFEGLIRRVRSTVTEALDNQDIPFERIVTAVLPGSRDMSRNPLVQLIFALHSQQDLNTIQLEGLTGEPIATAFSTRFDVEFHLFQENDMLKGSVLFATDLFEHSTIQNMVAVFQETLLRGLEEPKYLTLLDSKALASVFAQEEVRVAFFPTALLKQYLTEIPSALAGLELLYVGGERLDSHDAIQARALVPSVYNVYGPTESHICTVYKVEENEELTNGTPIGRAVNDTGVYIMDAQQKLVSKGVLGELVVTGDGLARGYTDPALDVNRFIEVAIDPEHKAVRAYRTGDLVRYRPKDGQIEFFGRMDQQIKIRGHRIELAEVEQAIMGHHKVRDVAVVVRGKDGQDQEMIGFVLPRGSTTKDDLSSEDISNQPQPAEDSNNMLRTLEERMEKDIRDRIQSHLPSYMVPTRIIALRQMPLNANGKVDRKTLTEMAEKVPKSKVVERVQRTKVIEFSRQRKVANGESSNSDVEVILCEEFADVLGVEVCLSDNFFDLGGHSLMSIKLAGRISHHLGARVSVKDIFDHPTPVGLAKKIWNSRLQTHGTHI